MDNNKKIADLPQVDTLSQIDNMISNIMGLCHELNKDSYPTTIFGFYTSSDGNGLGFKRFYVGTPEDMPVTSGAVATHLINNPDLPQRTMILSIVSDMIAKDPSIIYELNKDFLESKAEDENFGGLFLACSTPLAENRDSMLAGVGSSKAILEAIAELCLNDRNFADGLWECVSTIKRMRRKFDIEVVKG